METEASNKVQANKKTLSEAANILLAMPVDKETKAELKRYRFTNDNCTYAMALVIAQLKNALNGDTRAFIAIRDIIGEKPKDSEQDEFEMDNNIIINVIPTSEADIDSE